MQDAFISYRRVPSYPTAQLIQKTLEIDHEIDAYLDVTRSDGARVQFPERLLNAIAQSKVFVCLLSEGTLDSEWVLKEIRQAHALRKPCLPVFQEDWAGYIGADQAICYLLSFDGVHVMEKRGLFMDESIAQIAQIIKVTNAPRLGSRMLVGIFGVLASLALLAGAALILMQQYEMPSPLIPSATLVQPAISVPAETATPYDLSAVERLATLHAMETQIGLTQAAQQTMAIMMTQAAASLTEQVSVTETSAAMGEALAHTPMPASSPTWAEQVMARARAGVRANRDWTPHSEMFDGIPMMLVPAGCFSMGNPLGDTDERPVHEVCFADPFWIDQTEVTQVTLRRMGGVTAWTSALPGMSRPVESINWVEARDFCARRGMRLPTEAEWEYAARGPDGLTYPWGNNLILVNAVHSGTTYIGTEDVMSRRGGVSWVGAHDLAGNVWEWTSSLYRPYPYDPTDGREETVSAYRADPARVVRGGSWRYSANYLRASLRYRYTPDYRDDNIGFRCARSS